MAQISLEGMTMAIASTKTSKIQKTAVQSSPAATKTTPSKATDPTKSGSNPMITRTPFRISPLTKGTRYLKLLIYGKHGTGKTSLAGSSVDVKEMRDILYLDVEAGKMSLTDSERIKHPEKIDIIRIESFEQIAPIHKFLKQHVVLRDKGDISKLKALQAKVFQMDVGDIKDSEVRQYRTVILDSLSEIQSVCMYKLLSIDVNKGSLSNPDMEVAKFDEYKKNNQMIQLILRAFRDLEMNVIFVCPSIFTEDEIKRQINAPALIGQLRDQVQGFVDMVGYLIVGRPGEAGEAPRRMFVQPSPKWDAKNRRSVYKKSYFDNPSMSDIMKGIKLI